LTEPVNRSTVALTAGQKVRLFGRVVPFVGFGLLALVYLVTVNLGIFPPPALLFYAFIAVVFVLLGYQAFQAMRDILSGVALVEEDILISMRHSRTAGNTRVGKFERLGTLQVSRQAPMAAAQRIKYRVTYSPGSKVVWSLEKADPYFRKY
jgi:xanthosine utilization system XapX-like protein